MSLIKYLHYRQLGINYEWDKFEEVYPYSDLKDWRRGHQIIKLRNQETCCDICRVPYQVMLIKIPDMIEDFGFETHVFFEYGCMSCKYYLYRDKV